MVGLRLGLCPLEPCSCRREGRESPVTGAWNEPSFQVGGRWLKAGTVSLTSRIPLLIGGDTATGILEKGAQPFPY